MNAWTMTDLWIVLAGSLAGIACSLPGSFLLLRRMSMMGDAISHAVLPGIAIAFFFSHSRGGPWMFAGAVAAGVFAAVLTQFLNQQGQVEEGASMGVVFTLMFAAGILLLDSPAIGAYVDLDLDCVLFGAVELVPLEPGHALMPGVPEPIVRLLFVALLNLLAVGLLFKEWKLSSFDPELAKALGFRPNLLHFLLMIQTAVTAVYCFEVAGSILVIAMLIVPAACARLLTDRLLPTLVISAVLSVVFAVAGHAAAMEIPAWFGFLDTSSAGAMSAVGGLFFLLLVLFAPRHGMLRNCLHRRHLARRTMAEDILAGLYRREELEASVRQPLTLSTGSKPVLQYLKKLGYISIGKTGPELTHNGFRAGAELLRRHRLWEGWLHEHTFTPLEHLHLSAETLEHVTTPELRERLAKEVPDSQHDPSGRRIPGLELTGGETLQTGGAPPSSPSSPGSSKREM